MVGLPPKRVVEFSYRDFKPRSADRLSRRLKPPPGWSGGIKPQNQRAQLPLSNHLKLVLPVRGQSTRLFTAVLPVGHPALSNRFKFRKSLPNDLVIGVIDTRMENNGRCSGTRSFVAEEHHIE